MGNEHDVQGGNREGKRPCACPFCDSPVEQTYPFCKDCGRELNHCTKCGKPLPPTQQVCPDCK